MHKPSYPYTSPSSLHHHHFKNSKKKNQRFTSQLVQLTKKDNKRSKEKKKYPETQMRRSTWIERLWFDWDTQMFETAPRREKTETQWRNPFGEMKFWGFGVWN
jgi:hypothetical protein